MWASVSQFIVVRTHMDDETVLFNRYTVLAGYHVIIPPISIYLYVPNTRNYILTQMYIIVSQQYG